MLAEIQSLLADADRSMLEVIARMPREDRSGHLCRVFVSIRTAQAKLAQLQRDIYENYRKTDTLRN